MGLEDDRYADTEGTFADRSGSDLTLIGVEALAAVERDYDIALESGVHRRNVTTDGVALNHLAGEQFRIGDVVCEGVELCEPCSYLEKRGSARRWFTAAGFERGFSRSVSSRWTIE